MRHLDIHKIRFEIRFEMSHLISFIFITWYSSNTHQIFCLNFMILGGRVIQILEKTVSNWVNLEKLRNRDNVSKYAIFSEGFPYNPNFHKLTLTNSNCYSYLFSNQAALKIVCWIVVHFSINNANICRIEFSLITYWFWRLITSNMKSYLT